jgi:hypothetical protein
MDRLNESILLAVLITESCICGGRGEDSLALHAKKSPPHRKAGVPYPTKRKHSHQPSSHFGFLTTPHPRLEIMTSDPEIPKTYDDSRLSLSAFLLGGTPLVLDGALATYLETLGAGEHSSYVRNGAPSNFGQAVRVHT